MTPPPDCYGSYRLEVRGDLEVVTPLHIGSGERLDIITDAPVLRTGNLHDGVPFIPGSSLRGILRSRLESEQSQIGVPDDAYQGFLWIRRQSGESRSASCFRFLATV